MGISWQGWNLLQNSSIQFTGFQAGIIKLFQTIENIYFGETNQQLYDMCVKKVMLMVHEQINLYQPTVVTR